MKGVNIAIAGILLSTFVFGGRYDLNNSLSPSGSVIKREVITINVKNPIPLKDFITLLSGLSGKRIVLMEEGSEQVWYVGRGTLSQILDTVLYPIGYYWEREGNKIVIRKFVSKVWRLYVPKLESQVSFNAKGTNLSYSYDYRRTLGESIRRILSTFVQRGRVGFDPNTGIVSFYGTYKEMKAIEGILSKLQDMLTQTVALRMDVIAVELKDEYQSGIDLSVLLRDPTRIGLNLTSSSAGSPFSLAFQTTRIEGLVTLLERFGKVRIVERRTFNAISGFPIVMTQVREVEYLKETRIGYVAPQQGVGQVVPTLEIKQDKVDEGSQLVLIPQKTNEGLILEVAYGSKRINEIRQKRFVVQNQETTLESPDVSRSDFSTIANLEEGESVVLVSSVIDTKKRSSEGIPFFIKIPFLKYLFGKHSSLSGKVQLFVAITYLGEEYDFGREGLEGGNGEGREEGYFPK